MPKVEFVVLHEFLTENEHEILAACEAKSQELEGPRPSTDQLKQGLPIFFKQLLHVLEHSPAEPEDSAIDRVAMTQAANDSNEPAIALAAGRPYEAKVAETARAHGSELHRFGYTLSHVVHGYGSMCQAITEMAIEKRAAITPTEFRKLNRCLDVAIAGAVTEFQAQRISDDNLREVQHLGSLAHELRNALTTVNISLRLIRNGTVGFGGSTGLVLDRGLKHIQELIDRSLAEVRLRVDPKVHIEAAFLLQLVDQIAMTFEVEARARDQVLDLKIDPMLVIEADQYLLYSALSNLVQNAIKYTHIGGNIQMRGTLAGDHAVIEIEDRCGGLQSTTPNDLFKPFEQQNMDRDGIGLGLTIAQRAIALNQGTIEVDNLPGTGCIFRIRLPRASSRKARELTHDGPLSSYSKRPNGGAALP
jgi:signal transduction histidine kinase